MSNSQEKHKVYQSTIKKRAIILSLLWVITKLGFKYSGITLGLLLLFVYTSYSVTSYCKYLNYLEKIISENYTSLWEVKRNFVAKRFPFYYMFHSKEFKALNSPELEYIAKDYYLMDLTYVISIVSLVFLFL